MKEKRGDNLNLLTQIQFYKNYSQHRKRLYTRYRSPISLKKSMSFDQGKNQFSSYLRERKQYTNQFIKKQQKKQNQTKDAIMLRKILEYNNKPLVLSKSNRAGSNLLHHNAVVMNNRNLVRVDLQNEKIHKRIVRAKARSLYNQEKFQSSRISPVCKALVGKVNTNSQMKQRNQSCHKIYTQYNERNQQSQDLQTDLFVNNQTKRLNNNQRQDQQQGKIDESQLLKEFKRSKFEPTMESNENGKIILCQRLRRERLANRLYQKRLKFNSSISSRIQSRRQN